MASSAPRSRMRVVVSRRASPARTSVSARCFATNAAARASTTAFASSMAPASERDRVIVVLEASGSLGRRLPARPRALDLAGLSVVRRRVPVPLCPPARAPRVPELPGRLVVVALRQALHAAVVAVVRYRLEVDGRAIGHKPLLQRADLTAVRCICAH